MTQRPVVPANAVLCEGIPLYEEMEVEEKTNMYPGRAVIVGTNDYQCKVSGAASTVVIGVLDIKSDGLYTTQYAVGDSARILRGDIVVVMEAASGETINVGTKLVVDAAGRVKAGVTAGQVIGYARTAKPTNGGDGDEKILVRLTGV